MTNPDKCNICGGGRVQYGGIKVQPIKMTSFQAQDTIKAAAKAKGLDIYNEIQDLDLIAKEFKMHEHSDTQMATYLRKCHRRI